MFFDLIKSRRSIRRYKKREIEKEKIDKLKQAVLFAPSSKGKSPWEFIFVDDKDILVKLSQSKLHGSAFLANASLAVVVIADPNKSDVWIEDASIASTFLLLSAEAIELGACWVQIRKRKYDEHLEAEEYIKTILSIPEDRRVLSIISLGYPAEDKEPKNLQDLEYSKIFLNRYGQY